MNLNRAIAKRVVAGRGARIAFYEPGPLYAVETGR